LEKGSIIELDFDLWLVENNELYETTNEELAKEHNIYNEDVTYKPISTIIGAEKLIKGLDDALLKAEKEKEYELEIPPEEGYGERDPKLVELHSKREILRLPEFRKGDMSPQVGMQITLKNRIGTITAITAGRVRLDFNNRLAGRTLKYKYKIVKVADKPEEKAHSIIQMHFNKPGDFDIKLKKDEAEITLPDVCKYDLGWFQTKYRVVSDLRDFAGINTVKFMEVYVKKKEEEEKKDEEDKPEAAPEGEPDKVKGQEEEKDASEEVKENKDTE
jgi:FKBP-type peptidyl-prolyl cis-trans isomerase 2